MHKRKKKKNVFIKSTSFQFRIADKSYIAQILVEKTLPHR